MKTKLRERASHAILRTYGYSGLEMPALSALVNFAAQNPRLDFANYGQVSVYQSESRSISADWRRVVKALHESAKDGATDAQIIEASKSAFCGRLTWGAKQHTPASVEAGEAISPGDWSYCTGQYWPTEYRKAAATVLEYAARAARQAHPKTKRTVVTISALRELNAANGNCWFEPATMRFFKTRIESGIIGRYFVSSEKGPDERRKFTVRSFDDEGSIDTEGEFQAYKTKAAALNAARECSRRDSQKVAA